MGVFIGYTRVVEVVIKCRKSSGSVYRVHKSSRDGFQVSQESWECS